MLELVLLGDALKCLLEENCSSFSAKKSRSPAEVAGKIVDVGFSSSAETRAFAEEIFARVPHNASSLNVSS